MVLSEQCTPSVYKNVLFGKICMNHIFFYDYDYWDYERNCINLIEVLFLISL